jgi:hypothetical protein
MPEEGRAVSGNTESASEERAPGPSTIRDKLAKQWLMPISLDLMLAGAFNLYGYSQDNVEIDLFTLSDNNAISGRIEKVFSGRSAYLGFRDESNQLIKCYVGLCGYKGWEAHIGRQAKVWMSDGKVVQISVDETVRKSAAQTMAVVRQTLDRDLLFVGAGLVILVVTLRRNRRLRNQLSGLGADKNSATEE